MKDKNIFITGGSSGIGKETTMQLAAQHAKVIFCGSDMYKGKKTENEIINATGNKEVFFIQADFCSFAAVRNLVKQLKERTNLIDVLINNAGFITNKYTLTTDQIESQWSVNYLSPYLLTRLLLNENLLSNGSRIINVSASAHAWTKGLDYDFTCSANYSGRSVYSKSKMALNMFTFYLASLLCEKGITVNCLHPGLIRTQFKADILVPPAVIFKYLFPSPKKGAKTTIFLATDNSLKNVTGKYFIGRKPAESSKFSLNIEEQKKLWHVSEQILKF